MVSFGSCPEPKVLGGPRSAAGGSKVPGWAGGKSSHSSGKPGKVDGRAGWVVSADGAADKLTLLLTLMTLLTLCETGGGLWRRPVEAVCSSSLFINAFSII